ncbi:hypothetical protein IJD44_10665 [bacterium]|nr:hypothetical protein [bacterium]
MTIQRVSVQNTAAFSATKKQMKEKMKGTKSALLAGSLASSVSIPLSLVSVGGITKIPKSMTPEEIKAMNNAADNILKMTKLADKGVKINHVKWGGLNLTGLPDSVHDLLNAYSGIAHGKNAAFSTKEIKNVLGEIMHEKNSILVNREKLPNAIFHEIGHAFNYNNSKFWRAMQGMRIPALILATGMMIYSAISKKSEAKDGKELTKTQKANNFVRENSGLLSTLSFAPVVLEETMASIRGCKWANSNLPKELAKKVAKTNAFGALSYIAAAIGVGLAAFAATKVKDKIVEKNKQKQLDKLNATV